MTTYSIYSDRDEIEAERPCHAPDDAWCGDRPALECEIDLLHVEYRLDDIYRLQDARGLLKSSHACACPDSAIIDELVASGPIVELGAGKGYWARLIRDRGGDILAIDKIVRSNLWSPLEHGNEYSLRPFEDRTLLVVMPPRPGFEGILQQWHGSHLVVVTEGPFPHSDSHKMWAPERRAMDDAGWRLRKKRLLPEVACKIVSPKHATFWERG